MMTSTTLQTNDIWSKTIGHDPHAGDAEAAEDAAARERQEERARGVTGPSRGVARALGVKRSPRLAGASRGEEERAQSVGGGEE